LGAGITRIQEPMLLLFCSEPFAPRTVDPAFEDEWNTAQGPRRQVPLRGHITDFYASTNKRVIYLINIANSKI
jgi:hypothetical protein